MTILQSEIEIFEALSFDSELSCEAYRAGCKNKAEWLFIKDCGCTLAFCAPHKAEAVIELKTEEFRGECCCILCDGVTVSEMCRWEPI